MRLLLIEDEKRLVEALAFMLKKNNYAVDVAYDGYTGQELAESGIYDLIILDRMLPRKEGVVLLKELRQKGISTPVLILTARDAVTDRVEGLNAGADDYLIKPFAIEELLARVKALGRRPALQVKEDRLRAGGLRFDPLLGEISNGEVAIRLTVKESQLLEYLMRNPGRVLNKEQIMNKVWGYDAVIETNAVEIYVHFLRKKLRQLSVGTSIETVRGIGYCLREG
ncbi:MAG: response regulator transcription factor [Firmicutes bacterium]|nr:response regulator transcription factor [Bacillota bacterium]